MTAPAPPGEGQARTLSIYCCQCGTEVLARLTPGRKVYPQRADLARLPFWRCDACGNSVGCHYKTANRTRPLGCIPGPDMKRARSELHKIIDPLWKSNKISRRDLYARLGLVIGREYHTAELRTLDEARQIYRAVLDLTSVLENSILVTRIAIAQAKGDSPRG